MKILIVDDEKNNLDLLREALKELDYRLLFAKDGLKALSQVAKHLPDLILLDVMMPEMNGYEVCEELKAKSETRDIPIMFVTAKGEEIDEMYGLELGAVDYITKPISPAIVRARVKTQLSLKKAQIELTLQNKRRGEELMLAKETQERLYPSAVALESIEKHGFKIFTFHRPTSEISGDFIHLRDFDDKGFSLTIADCKGHGVSAALMTMVACAFLSNMRDPEIGPGEVFTSLNDSLVNLIPAHEPIVAAQFQYIPKEGIFLGRAAFSYPLIFRCATKSIEIIKEGNIPLGYIKAEFMQVELLMDVGDRILMYSDGITDATNATGDSFAHMNNRLEQHLAKYATKSLDDCGKTLVDEWDNFHKDEKRGDDATFVLIERTSN